MTLMRSNTARPPPPCAFAKDVPFENQLSAAPFRRLGQSHGLHHRRAQLRRRPGDVDARVLQRRELLVGAALPAGDDGAGVSFRGKKRGSGKRFERMSDDGRDAPVSGKNAARNERARYSFDRPPAGMRRGRRPASEEGICSGYNCRPRSSCNLSLSLRSQASVRSFSPRENPLFGRDAPSFPNFDAKPRRNS